MHMPNCLSLFPNEIKVAIYSFLPPKDGDTMRLTSRSIKDLIDRHSKKIYARRISSLNVSFNGLPSVPIMSLRSKYLFIDYCCHFGNVKDITKNYKREHDVDEAALAAHIEELRKKCVGRSFQQCFNILIARSGGVALHVSSELNKTALSMIMPILNKFTELSLLCPIRITKEDAFQCLFAPKRKLFINRTVFLDNPELLDEQFCKEAGYMELRIRSFGKVLQITQAQLYTLLKRTDLELIELPYIMDLNLQDIRNVVQKMLVGPKRKCDLRFRCENYEQAKVIFSKVLGLERLRSREKKIYWSSHPEIFIRYSLGSRTIRVTLTPYITNDGTVIIFITQ